ncbi:Essential protein Yae1, N terminal [Myotisia sp. PD_48]|nr:Essential protein Yae1, N terminal [Myotisia sp. PD_48]
MSPSSIATMNSDETSLESLDTALSSPTSDTLPADPPPPFAHNNLDDIFGSSPAESNINPNLSDIALPPQLELSEIPSLRRQHVTAGYRDGVAAAKANHVQEGFDKGYPIGIDLGLRVGMLQGVLEGLVNRGAAVTSKQNTNATASSADPNPAPLDIEEVKKIYEQAKSELCVEKIFGSVSADQTDNEMDQDQTQDDPCSRLDKCGNVVVTDWEQRIRRLLSDGPQLK